MQVAWAPQPTAATLHRPASQASLVQTLPSVQGLPALVAPCVQPLADAHASSVQALPSSQFIAAAGRHTPDWHESPAVHALPSVQALPSTFDGFEHVPALQAPALWH